MGNRYLAYRLDRESFAVGPDDAQLAALGPSPAALEPLRLAEFFAYQELSGAATFFAGVRALLPGELLVVEPDREHRRQLPGPRLDLRIELPRWEEYVEALHTLLGEAVARSLARCDRAAALLSGGLDSTPIAAFAARELAARGSTLPLTALVWRVSDPRADDAPFAEEAARELGLDLVWIDGDDALPLSDPERWPVHPSTPEQTAYRWLHERSFARAQERGLGVVLAGFGGDALYANAHRWFWHLAAAEGLGRAIDRLRGVAATHGWPRALRHQVLGPLLPRSRALRRTLPPWLTADAASRLRQAPRWPPGVVTARRPRQAERLLALLDAHGDHVERWYTGRFGLQQETPLRDAALVQFFLAVPDHVLHQGNVTRPALRSAIAGLVPERTGQRTGMASFAALLVRGLGRERLGWARRLLEAPDALWRGFIDAAEMARWLERPDFDGWGLHGLLHAIFAELWRARALPPQPARTISP